MTSTLTVEASGHECDVKLQTWLRDILPRTPGAVRKVAARELVLAAREFFERSAAWRVVIGPKDLRAVKKRYTLSPYDAYSDVVQILGVELEGCPLQLYTRQPALGRSADRPLGFWLESPDTVRLWPTPTVSVDEALTFAVALAPKLTVSHLPRMAQTHFYEALFDGVLGRMYAHPSKPYTDPTLAQYHLKRFRNAIGAYAGQAKQGFAPGAVSWRFPRFGK